MSRLEKVVQSCYTNVEIWKISFGNKKGCDTIKKKTAYISLSVFAVNLVLFITKLYVGLASNSISIYSDGVNNLFDSLTSVLSFFMLITIAKEADMFSRFRLEKTEQLLSFIISVTIAFSAFYFAYNSLERLTNPIPVAYSVRYLVLIVLTAAVKLIMFFILRIFAGRLQTAVIKLISLDSLLDFFITSVTVITLLLSKDGKYTIDAFCGIGISTVILVSAVRNVLSSVRALTGEIGREKREFIQEILKDTDVSDISFVCSGEKTKAYIRIYNKEKTEVETLSGSIEKETGIKAYFIAGEKGE